ARPRWLPTAHGCPGTGHFVTVTVRRLTAGDEQLALEALGQLADDPPDAASTVAFLASASAYLVVGYWKGLPAGFAIAYPLPYFDGRGEMLFLWEIGTAECYRRRGVARAIVEYLLDEARREGYSEMFVITNSGNSEAMPLYETTGGVREALDDVVFAYYFGQQTG
ncbi:MAG: GNAT family N-acetyltransferase, partial [Tepidiformaceae bacterium]